MRPLRPMLATILAAATAAAAQAPNGAAAPQPQGFFSPQPQADPSLFHTLPPEAYQPPAPQPPASQPPVRSTATAGTAPQASTAPMIVVVPQPGENAQEQLDRAQLEAQQARAQAYRAPAPINGAFTGLTDERDR